MLPEKIEGQWKKDRCRWKKFSSLTRSHLTLICDTRNFLCVAYINVKRDARLSDLCPFGKDIQVIAVYVTLITLPSRGFLEDSDFFQLRHKRGRRLIGYVEPLGDLGDGNRGRIEQLLQNPDGYRGGNLFLPQQTAMIGLEFEDLPGRIHRGASTSASVIQELLNNIPSGRLLFKITSIA
jgi:hypothetical protein